MRRELRTVERRFSLRELFAPIDGRTYSGEKDFQLAVIDLFNQHLRDFPPHYSYRDAITWAMRQRWLTVNGSRIVVSLPVEELPAAPLLLAA
jgi:hypothetical protein